MLSKVSDMRNYCIYAQWQCDLKTENLEHLRKKMTPAQVTVISSKVLVLI